jgi:4-hydroxybenzoate polyprenyltransferase
MKFENLESAYHYWKKSPSAEDGRRLLMDKDEEVVISYMLAHDAEGVPLTKENIVGAVREWKKKDDSWNSWRWWNGFMGRHKDLLRLRSGKPLDKVRNAERLSFETTTFINWYERVLATYRPPPRNIINADESPLRIQPQDIVNAIVVDASKTRADALLPKFGRHVTVLPFINAEGKVLLSVYIMSASGRPPPKGHEVNIEIVHQTRPYSQRDYWSRMYMATDFGFINGPGWFDCLKKLRKVIKPFSNSSPVVIICDNASPHKDISAIEWMMKKNMHLVYLPPNTTHLLQPLDQQAFANWKRQLLALTRSQSSVLLSQSANLTDVLMQVAPEAERRAFTPKVLKASWNQTGLYPFDSAKVLSRVKQAISPPKSTPTSTPLELSSTVHGLINMFRSDIQAVPQKSPP